MMALVLVAMHPAKMALAVTMRVQRALAVAMRVQWALAVALERLRRNC